MSDISLGASLVGALITNPLFVDVPLLSKPAKSAPFAPRLLTLRPCHVGLQLPSMNFRASRGTCRRGASSPTKPLRPPGVQCPTVGPRGNPFKLQFLQLGAQLSPDFAGPSRPPKWWKMAGNGGEYKILGPRLFPEIQDWSCPFRFRKVVGNGGNWRGKQKIRPHVRAAARGLPRTPPGRQNGRK